MLTGSTANLNGDWSNLGGTITTDATSTLNWGQLLDAELGTLSLAAGRCNVTGTWNNSGQSFTFNAATGSWTLNGGSITGGSIGFADSQTLVIAANLANLLSGVTVNGDLTLNTSQRGDQDRRRHDLRDGASGRQCDRPRLCAGADARWDDPV